MLNAIWLILLAGSTVIAILTGHTKELVVSTTESAGSAFKLALGFTGVMALWLGIMKIAEESGLVQKFTGVITPLMRILFRDVPEGHPALGSMAMNIAANMFGLNNAATPIGIRAMTDLDSLNSQKGTATDAMCMFLAINTSSVQLVPAGAIALLAAGGSSDPTSILFPAVIATAVSTTVGILGALTFSKLPCFRMRTERGQSDDGVR